MKTLVLIDGFNLYYRLKKEKHLKLKWLNVSKLMHRYLPDHDVQALKYFTARVKYTSHDPSKTLRQSTYLRALSTLPEVQIICGRFKKRHVRGPRCFYDRDKKGSFFCPPSWQN